MTEFASEAPPERSRDDYFVLRVLAAAGNNLRSHRRPLPPRELIKELNSRMVYDSIRRSRRKSDAADEAQDSGVLPSLNTRL